MRTGKRDVLYIFVALLASLNFSLAYGRLLNQPFDFPSYAHGTAPYPYQSRILMAIVFAYFEHSKFLATLSAHAHAPLNVPLRMLVVLVAFPSILIATYFVRLSLGYLGLNKDWSHGTSLVVLFMAYFQYILASDSPFIAPYDLPSLAVFSAGLYLLFARRWVWYYLVFIVGTFNRETTCFLTMFLVFFELFPLKGKRATPLSIGLHVVVQAALWCGIRYYSAHFFSATPSYGDFTLLANLNDGISPKHWASLFSCFGFLWLVCLFGFKKIPYTALRWGAWVMVPWFAVMMFAGRLFEIRIFGDLIPYMAICTVLILKSYYMEGHRRLQGVESES